MKRIVLCVLTSLVCAFVMCSCGHSMLHVDRGVGMKLRIPTPEGGSIIDFAIGQIDSSTAVMRGNTAFNTSSTGGASITGTANMTQQIQMTTGTQLNEGNIVKVMESSNCPPEAKIEVAKSLTKSTAPATQPSVSKTPSAVVTTGVDGKDVQLAKSTVATVAEAAPKILESSAKPIEATSKPIEATTKPVENALTSTVVEAADAIENVVGKAALVIIIIGALLIVVGAYFLYKYAQYKMGKKNAGQSDKQAGSEGSKSTVVNSTESGSSVDSGSTKESTVVQQEAGTTSEVKTSDQSTGDTSSSNSSSSEEVNVTSDTSEESKAITFDQNA